MTREEKGRKKEKPERLASCKYILKHELNKTILELDCEGCAEDPGIENPSCRMGILYAMKSNTNINAIITNHYREIQYVDASLEIMKKICIFMDNIDKMAIREPYSDYFGNLNEKRKDHTIAMCKNCPVYPELFFSELKDNIMKSFVDTYVSFDKMTTQFQKFQPSKSECTKCKSLMSQDLVYLFNQMEDIRAIILNKGFQILI